MSRCPRTRRRQPRCRARHIPRPAPRAAAPTPSAVAPGRWPLLLLAAVLALPLNTWHDLGREAFTFAAALFALMLGVALCAGWRHPPAGIPTTRAGWAELRDRVGPFVLVLAVGLVAALGAVAGLLGATPSLGPLAVLDRVQGGVALLLWAGAGGLATGGTLGRWWRSRPARVAYAAAAPPSTHRTTGDAHVVGRSAPATRSTTARDGASVARTAPQ